MSETLPTFVDFFAGSGLVTQGARHACIPVWSNDICPKKAASYTSNHGDDHFHLGSIEGRYQSLDSKIFGCIAPTRPLPQTPGLTPTVKLVRMNS